MVNTIGTPILNRYVMHVRPGSSPFSWYMDDIGVTPVNYVPTDIIDKSMMPSSLNTGDSQLVLVPKVGGTASALHVPLVYKDYIDRVANPDPAPSVSTNPTIPNVTAWLGTSSVTSDWLLDSGAAVTMVGRNLAASLGVDLSGAGVTSIVVMGIGGTTTLTGYEIDKLALSTAGGGTLNFNNIVVFVPKAGDMPADLPGIFGMNLLNDAFDHIDPESGEEISVARSAFSDWYVVPAAVPEPATIVLLATAASLFVLRRRLRRRR
jgi:hypothetical protein